MAEFLFGVARLITIVAAIFFLIYGLMSFHKDMTAPKPDVDPLSLQPFREYTVHFLDREPMTLNAHNAFVDGGVLWFVDENEGDLASVPLSNFRYLHTSELK